MHRTLTRDSKGGRDWGVERVMCCKCRHIPSELLVRPSSHPDVTIHFRLRTKVPRPWDQPLIVFRVRVGRLVVPDLHPLLSKGFLSVQRQFYSSPLPPSHLFFKKEKSTYSTRLLLINQQKDIRTTIKYQRTSQR